MVSSLTSSVLYYSCHTKHSRGEPDRILGDFPGDIKILVVYHIPPDSANTNYLRRKSRAQVAEGKCFVWVFSFYKHQ